MPCSKRGQSGDLEYKKIIASLAGKVNRNSPTKNGLGKFSSDGIFHPRRHFGSVRAAPEFTAFAEFRPFR